MNQQVNQSETFPRQISWGNLIPVATLNVLVFGVGIAIVPFLPMKFDDFGGIANLLVKLFVLGGG